MAIDTRFGADFNEVNIDKSYKATERDAQRDESHFEDWGKVLSDAVLGGTKAATSIGSNIAASDANTAKQDYFNIVSSEGYREASSTVKSEMLSEMQNTLPDRSTAYQNAYIGYAAGETIRQIDGRQEELNISKLNTLGSTQMAWMGATQYDVTDDLGNPVTNEEAGKTPADFAEAFKKENPSIEMSTIRNAQVGQLYQGLLTEVRTATSKKQLEDTLISIREAKEPYTNPMFLTTKQKQGADVIKTYEATLSAAIKAKEAQFKGEAYTRLAVAEQGGSRLPLAAVEQDIDDTSSNDLIATKSKSKYQKDHEERTTADAYNSTYAAGDRPGYLPDNKTLKEERQEGVTASLFDSFNKSNMVEFVRVAQNEKGMTKQAGDQFITMFNNATSKEEIDVLMDKFDLIDAQPQGASILRQMLTDDEYTRVKEIGYALQSRPDLTPGQARDWIDGNKAKLNTLGLPPAKQRKLFEYAVKLGPQYDAYMSHMKNVMLGNPSIGEKEMKEAALHFSKMNQVDSTGKKTNVAMGTNPADDPSVMDKKDVDAKINKSLGDTVTNKTFLSNGIVIGKDEYGGTMKIINTKDKVDTEGNTTIPGVITQSNTETAERLKLEKDIANFQRKGGMGAVQGFWESGKLAFKNVFRDTIDNFTEIPKGLAKSGGTLVDKFQQHLYDSMTTGQKDWWDKLTEEDKSELVHTEIDNKLNELDTEEGLEGVQNVILSDSDLIVFENGVWQNKVDSAVLKEIQEVIVGVPTDVLEHLEVREGSRNKTYKDSLGKLTAGVGHLLSKEEQKKYPLGTKIPASVVKGWIRKDSKKAYTSAGEQAKELKVTSPEFVNALTSVNFQLGTSWYKKFPKAYQALKDKRYDDAIREVETSLWAKQTPVRVKDFKEAINKLR